MDRQYKAKSKGSFDRETIFTGMINPLISSMLHLFASLCLSMLHKNTAICCVHSDETVHYFLKVVCSENRSVYKYILRLNYEEMLQSSIDKKVGFMQFYSFQRSVNLNLAVVYVQLRMFFLI